MQISKEIVEEFTFKHTDTTPYIVYLFIAIHVNNTDFGSCSNLNPAKQSIKFLMMHTVPVDKRLNKFTTVELVVAVGVMHLEVVELQLLLGHVRRIDRNVHVFFHVP